jgi:hypothetical protein
MHEVPLIRTPVSEHDAASALVAALAALAEHPHQREAELLLAQLWLETGRGNACCNFNVGNISASDRYEGGAFRPPWFVIDASSGPLMVNLHNEMLKGRVPRAFRAYATLEAGMGDYVNQIFHTFHTIVDAARLGDAEAMAAAIKTSRYTPDAPLGTGRSLDSIAKEFASRGTFAALPLAGASVAPTGAC